MFDLCLSLPLNRLRFNFLFLKDVNIILYVLHIIVQSNVSKCKVVNFCVYLIQLMVILCKLTIAKP